MTKKIIKSALVLGILVFGVQESIQAYVRVYRPPVYVAPAATVVVLPATSAVVHVDTAPKTVVLSASSVKFTTINKEKIALDKFKGKVVILNFFATWCPPCRLEIPHFVDLENTYKKLVIIGISVDQAPELLPDFIKKMSINYPVALQTPEMSKLFGNFSSIPTTIIIDKNGNVVEVVTGYQDKAFWESKIKPLF